MLLASLISLQRCQDSRLVESLSLLYTLHTVNPIPPGANPTREAHEGSDPSRTGPECLTARPRGHPRSLWPTRRAATSRGAPSSNRLCYAQPPPPPPCPVWASLRQPLLNFAAGSSFSSPYNLQSGLIPHFPGYVLPHVGGDGGMAGPEPCRETERYCSLSRTSLQ